MLEQLFLNNCQITDIDACKIFDTILNLGNKKIRKLYMNDNQLSNVTALKVAKVIADQNLKIKEIGLKWNIITAVGGNAIAEALCTNSELKCLDLSWNRLGELPKDKPNPKDRSKMIKVMQQGDVGKAWGTAFVDNKTLVHLDMSQNRFDQFETKAMMDDLTQNHTLVGFHFQGNTGTAKEEPMDPKKKKKLDEEKKKKEAEEKKKEKETGIKRPKKEEGPPPKLTGKVDSMGFLVL